MTLINFTNVTGATGYAGLLSGIDDAAGNWFMIMLVISIFVVSFINLSYTKSKYALIMSSFITGISCSFFWWAGMIPYYLLVISLVLIMVFLIIAFIDEG